MSSLLLPEDVPGWIAYFFLVCILPAFVEELIFRGLILGSLAGINRLWALLISAVLFGAFHGTLDQIPFAILVGLMLGAACLYFRSIYVAMAIHAANNFISVIMQLVSTYCDEKTANRISLLLMGSLILLCCFGGFPPGKERTSGKTRRHGNLPVQCVSRTGGGFGSGSVGVSCCTDSLGNRYQLSFDLAGWMIPFSKRERCEETHLSFILFSIFDTHPEV